MCSSRRGGQYVNTSVLRQMATSSYLYL